MGIGERQGSLKLPTPCNFLTLFAFSLAKCYAMLQISDPLHLGEYACLAYFPPLYSSLFSIYFIPIYCSFPLCSSLIAHPTTMDLVEYWCLTLKILVSHCTSPFNEYVALFETLKGAKYSWMGQLRYFSCFISLYLVSCLP